MNPASAMQLLMDARGLGEAELTADAKRRSMDELAAAIAAADKVLVF